MGTKNPRVEYILKIIIEGVAVQSPKKHFLGDVVEGAAVQSKRKFQGTGGQGWTTEDDVRTD